ncbi:LxmA leader domain family RiPP [Streptomyces wuyuanensis]
MNTQDLFAGYDIHIDAEEIAAEATIDDADFNADVTVWCTSAVC